MHNKIGYYFLLIISICTFNYMIVDSYIMPLKGKIIYLDPGHGGVDNGASYQDIYEDVINLEICYEIKSKLENIGATVYMTRYDDYDLSNNDVSYRKKSDLYNRAKIINESNSDIYLSIHLNYINSSKWNGAQVFFTNKNNSNSVIAASIQNRFNNNRKSMIIKDRYMYNLIHKPGVLIELGFLSNSKDRDTLLNNKKREVLINSIVDGIVDYYNVK